MHKELNDMIELIQELKARCDIGWTLLDASPMYKPENIEKVRDFDYYVSLNNRDIATLASQLERLSHEAFAAYVRAREKGELV